MRIQVSQEARADLLEADQHYSAIHPFIAERLLNEFKTILNHIGRFPRSGIPYRKKFRIFPLHEFPYLVVCHIKKEQIHIIGFIHKDRHPKHRLRRIT